MHVTANQEQHGSHPHPCLVSHTFPNSTKVPKPVAVHYFSITESKKTKESLSCRDGLQAVLHHGALLSKSGRDGCGDMGLL